MPRRSPPSPVLLLLKKFKKLKDPRVDRTKLHSLENILVFSMCAAICGADGWDDIAFFAEGNEEWFSTFLDMPHGTPSADTFRRVFEALDPVVFERMFRAWVKELGRDLQGEVVAIDGKSIKRAVDRARPTVPLHVVHVWATRQGLLLAQKKVDGAPGEVRAVQEIVRELDLRGAVVTTDANSCTAATTQAIRERQADYVLALKGNRGRFHGFVKKKFEAAAARSYRGVPKCTTSSRGHGRKERRTVRAVPIADWPAAEGSAWTDVRTAVLVERTRTVSGRTTTETHYYISSLPPEPRRLAEVIRDHWKVENSLHWTLDVTFREDERRIRDEVAAQNFGVITRTALMLLKRTPGLKKDTSIARKRKGAGWHKDFLARVLLSGFEAN
jgi:predicted transposase YbfD/YdcC